MKAIIVGAGIAGLGAALALQQRGWQITIVEQAAELKEIGAGIQLGPNATRILRELKVLPRLEPKAFAPEAIEMVLGNCGCEMFSMPLGEAAEKRWGAPYWHVHRADLLAAMVAELASGSQIEWRLGEQVSGYKSGAVNLKSGDWLDADLIIGADGLRSTIRKQMHPKTTARFTGNVAWRAVVPASRLSVLAPPPVARIWAGEKKHAVTTRVRGAELVNFVGIIEQDEAIDEGWELEGRREQALKDFGAWHATISTIIQEADGLNQWALYDHAPLDHWHDGPVVLIGDAAHPMLPSLAQGAAQGLEDAMALVSALEAEPSVEEANAAFYQARIERVTKVQNASSDNLRLFHKSGVLNKTIAYGPIWLADKIIPWVFHRRYDWLFAAPSC